MIGLTHAIIGASATLALIPDPSLPVVGVAILSSLLPDIDHPRSIMGRLFLRAPAALLPHRGPTHSAAALLLVGLAVWQFLPADLAFAAVIGYGGHILADSLTHAGVPIFWPLSSARIRAPLTIPTGGLVEWALCMSLWIYVVYWIFTEGIA